jgi:hypothetical protein
MRAVDLAAGDAVFRYAARGGAPGADLDAALAGDDAMEHLAGIEDWATRNAVDIAQSQYELMILELLHGDPGKPLAYLEAARQRMLDHVKSLGVETIAIDEEAKSTRIALQILEKTFERLIDAVTHADDEDGAAGQEPD